MDRDTAQILERNPQAIDTAQKGIAEVVARSATDAEVRKLLLSDARAALAQHFGREIPESVNVVFVEGVPGATTVVLPDPVDASAELSDSELEVVAGGALPILAYYAIGFALAALGDALT
jgi:hypothetical protein